MKNLRQLRILEIVRNEDISTQEELIDRLRREGFNVTQATVSRDIKQLHLVKAPLGDGRYRYIVSDEYRGQRQVERLRRVFLECVSEIDGTENLVVVKALSGTGPAVGEAIDGLGWPEIIGTIAGDNTVLAILRKKGQRNMIMERLRRFLS